METTALPLPTEAIKPMWKIENIADYFAVSKDVALRMANGDFPKPLVLPSTGRGERQIKRWFPEAIVGWATNRAAV